MALVWHEAQRFGIWSDAALGSRKLIATKSPPGTAMSREGAGDPSSFPHSSQSVAMAYVIAVPEVIAR